MKIKTKNERMGCDGKGLVTWHNKWLSFHQQTRIQPMFTFVISSPIFLAWSLSNQVKLSTPSLIIIKFHFLNLLDNKCI
jgi:cell division protein FtsW (lipid II flippase)